VRAIKRTSSVRSRSELVNVITQQPGFGQQPKNRFMAKNRAREVEKLCSDNASKHSAGLPEKEAIVRLLVDAYPLCNDRNYLAHDRTSTDNRPLLSGNDQRRQVRASILSGLRGLV
jgi:hypothetical protein